jgi:hypothetical protein
VQMADLIAFYTRRHGAALERADGTRAVKCQSIQ